MRHAFRAALGKDSPNYIFTNLSLFNPFSCSWEETSFGVKNGYILGFGKFRRGKEYNLREARVIPGLIDAHVHIESSLLKPSEFGRLVLKHGTTTVIADPHEIANVIGMRGIQYMVTEAKRTPLDIFFMVPSCVPASPTGRGGAELKWTQVAHMRDKGDFLGLGEVMNTSGVLNENEDVWHKLSLFRIIDGHAPLLSGQDLDAYICAGVQSDHESISANEAMEKLRKGMYIMIREGSTESNLKALSRCVSPCSISRWSFATDDRHADTIACRGHIDDCIRTALAMGVEFELALRMATLSPCDRFVLADRGAIAPGRLADFCILASDRNFHIKQTFKRGIDVSSVPHIESSPIRHVFKGTCPDIEKIALKGKGNARIIGLRQNQIVTDELIHPIEGEQIPDLDRDILKVIVCSRYYPDTWGLGLVKGFGLMTGALASSVSHDSHNIVATGIEDNFILKAIDYILKSNGGLVAVKKDKTITLPLTCAGLMSNSKYEVVVNLLARLEKFTDSMGAIKNPFMYLSFLSLTVIPHLRITDRGLVDVERQQYVPLFNRKRPDLSTKVI